MLKRIQVVRQDETTSRMRQLWIGREMARTGIGQQILDVKTSWDNVDRRIFLHHNGM